MCSQDAVSANVTRAPYSEFIVIPGRRYRFRVIGATCNHCYVRFGVEDHSLKLIATDGHSVKPVQVDYLEIASGERYDFVIEAKREVRSYWIVARGMGDNSCEMYSGLQLAILRYKGSNEETPETEEPGLIFNSLTRRWEVLNPQNSTCSGDGVCIAQLDTVENFDRRILNPDPDVSFTLTFGYTHPSVEELFKPNIYKRFTFPVPRPDGLLTLFWINNISETNPPSPVLSQRQDIPSDVFCEEGSNGVPQCRNQTTCSCFHMLRVKRGAVTQFVLMDKCYWLFHCHFLYHHTAGMSMVIQVGNFLDMPPVPSKFPKCGNYLPTDHSDPPRKSTIIETFISWLQNASQLIS
ncbi:hypothetical protein L9F63_001216, partial [Diploptera punctata]